MVADPRHRAIPWSSDRRGVPGPSTQESPGVPRYPNPYPTPRDYRGSPRTPIPVPLPRDYPTCPIRLSHVPYHTIPRPRVPRYAYGPEMVRRDGVAGDGVARRPHLPSQMSADASDASADRLRATPASPMPASPLSESPVSASPRLTYPSLPYPSLLYPCCAYTSRRLHKLPARSERQAREPLARHTMTQAREPYHALKHCPRVRSTAHPRG